MLYVSEIFRGIQGESTFAGLPCAFVRLSGCNLNCRHCDTGYARVPGRPMCIEAVLAELAAYPPGLAEITGGEPLLQADAGPLADALAHRGWTVLLETNGSIELPTARNYRAIVDLKCPSSGESESFCAVNAERLEPGDEVKFVVADRQDFEWSMRQIEAFTFERRHIPLLLSPVWGVCNPADLAEWILDSGRELRLHLQLHKVVWPSDSRGR